LYFHINIDGKLFVTTSDIETKSLEDKLKVEVDDFIVPYIKYTILDSNSEI